MLKAGMTGIAEITTTRLSSLDARISKLESGNSYQFAETAASITPVSLQCDALACGFTQEPVVLCLEELIAFEPDAVLRVEMHEFADQYRSNASVNGVLDARSESASTGDLSLEAVYDDTNWCECIHEAASERPLCTLPLAR